MQPPTFSVHRRSFAWWAAVLATIGTTSIGLRSARADSCNGVAFISYLSVPAVNTLGSIDRVQIQLVAGIIQGGTTISIPSVFFDLDCQNRRCSVSGAPCTGDVDCPAAQFCLTACVDDGAVMGYVGNISSDCGVTWSTNNAGGIPGPTSPNHVVFTPNNPVVLAAGGGTCQLQFDVQVRASTSNDDTPLAVEQQAGYTGTCNTEPPLGAAPQISGSVSITASQTNCVGVTGVLRSLPRR